MHLYEALAILTVIATVFGYINYRFIRLPDTIGVMLISVVASLSIIAIGHYEPQLFREFTAFIRGIDFYTVLVRIMLGFLLFAGAIHIHANELHRLRAPILTFSTVSVVLSTFITGALFYWLCRIVNEPVGFIYCLLFGALISPTDPIAVLSLLKKAGIPRSLEVKITAESLFNDGVAIVLFICMYEMAVSGTENLSPMNVFLLFVRQAGGGIVLGLALGYAGYLLLRSIDYYQLEIMITVSIVMGGSLLAETLGVSGPLAMVIAGIVTGNKSRLYGMSDLTRDYLDKFWALVDNLLNAVLFLLIGFELLIVPFRGAWLFLGGAAIVVVLLARLLSVWIPIRLLRLGSGFHRNSAGILTWAGLRGGLSLALALSLPADMHGSLFLVITYMIVLFSILVQGLTIGRFAASFRR
ncbi:MAG TPA: sodium:proton antiporter [Puia sp.]|jgi:CPA1 family monovalent cation:H+ antiporter|nr:sodium:proton antiporter [Puia sp.]